MAQIRTRHRSIIHYKLGKVSERYTDKTTLTLYGLQYGAYHLGCVPDKEKLWMLLRNENYRETQYHRRSHPEDCLDAFKQGIAQQILQRGKTLQDDGRLAWMSLRASEFIQEVIGNVEKAFKWYKTDAQRLHDAITMLQILNTERFFQSCLLLMEIEAQRQEHLSAAQKDLQHPMTILSA